MYYIIAERISVRDLFEVLYIQSVTEVDALHETPT